MTISHPIGDQPPVFATSSPSSLGVPRECGHCGAIHGGTYGGTCPRIKSIAYFPNGQISSVEYHPQPAPIGSVTVSVEAIAGCGDPAPHEAHYATLNDRPYICPGNPSEALLSPSDGPQDGIRGTAEGTDDDGATRIAPSSGQFTYPCGNPSPHLPHGDLLKASTYCNGIVALNGEQSSTDLCGRPSPFERIGPCTEPAGHVARYATWHAHLDRAKAMETRWAYSDAEKSQTVKTTIIEPQSPCWRTAHHGPHEWRTAENLYRSCPGVQS